MDVLTEEQRELWNKNGYVVVPNVVPEPMSQDVIRAIEHFLGKDVTDPQTWYDEPMYMGGIINMNHHQAMWETRQYPKLHKAFSEILGNERLAVSCDRTNMNPPYAPGWDHEGTIHWDIDSTASSVPSGVQGVLCLSDTLADQGGFQCVPGFHREFEEWKNRQPPDRPPMHLDTTGMQIVHVPANAGDLIIWKRTLPHGNSRNYTKRPRLCQYITMGIVADNHHGGNPIPLARTHRRVVADALSVPEGLVETWLRNQREMDRVVIRVDRVEPYTLVPQLTRLEVDGNATYINRAWISIIDNRTVETSREHAERYELPIANQSQNSVTHIRRTMQTLPRPRWQPSLTETQMQTLSRMLADGPDGEEQESPLWDEESVAQLMVREFGMDLDIQEAELTPLGRRLAGVDSWN